MSWGGLASFGNGAIQGAQNAQGIRAKAQQIQEAQLVLDQHKKQLQADAMAFANLGQPMGGGQGGQPPMQPPPQQMGPQAQPMPPGQSSMPAQQQPGMSGPPAVPPAGGAPMPPGGQPQQVMPAGPQGAGGAGQAAPPAGQQQPGMDPTDPQAPIKALFSIAQEIKSRNPGIDPQTLLLATQRVVEMSKGLDPAMRASMQLLATQLRNQTSERNTDVRADTSRDVAAGHDATSAANTADRTATTRRGQDIGASNVAARGAQAMQRAQFVQGELTKRFGQGQGNTAQAKAMTERVRAVTAQLRAATQQLGVLKNTMTGTLDENDPRVKKAAADVAEANAKLDILENRLKSGQQAQAAPADAAGGAAPLTATDAKGNKVQFVNGQWVPMGK